MASFSLARFAACLGDGTESTTIDPKELRQGLAALCRLLQAQTPAELGGASPPAGASEGAVEGRVALSEVAAQGPNSAPGSMEARLAALEASCAKKEVRSRTHIAQECGCVVSLVAFCSLVSLSLSTPGDPMSC